MCHEDKKKFNFIYAYDEIVIIIQIALAALNKWSQLIVLKSFVIEAIRETRLGAARRATLLCAFDITRKQRYMCAILLAVNCLYHSSTGSYSVMIASIFTIEIELLKR